MVPHSPATEELSESSREVVNLNQRLLIQWGGERGGQEDDTLKIFPPSKRQLLSGLKSAYAHTHNKYLYHMQSERKQGPDEGVFCSLPVKTPDSIPGILSHTVLGPNAFGLPTGHSTAGNSVIVPEAV